MMLNAVKAFQIGLYYQTMAPSRYPSPTEICERLTASADYTYYYQPP